MHTLLEPLLENAVTEFFTEIGETSIIPQATALSDTPVDLFILIGFTGQFKGFLTFTTSRHTAENLSRQLHEHMEMPFTPSPTSVKSAMGELVNMLAGKLITRLDEQNISCNITPPTIFLGTDLKNDYADLETCSSMDITGKFGRFRLDFALKT